MVSKMNATKRIRTKLGLTIAELAGVVGVSQGTVSRWENHQTYGHYPDVRHIGLLRDYALARGIPWDDSILFQEPGLSPVTATAEASA